MTISWMLVAFTSKMSRLRIIYPACHTWSHAQVPDFGWLSYDVDTCIQVLFQIYIKFAYDVRCSFYIKFIRYNLF